MHITEYGEVATAFESRSSLLTMFREVQEYFDVGASIAPGATVVDVGANIGAFAIAAAKRCRGQLRMFCFEPVPLLFRALERNLRYNAWLAHGDHRAFAVAVTAPEEAGTPCEFYYFRRLPRDSTMDLERKRAEFERFFAVHAERAARRVPWLGIGARALERTVRSLPRGPLGQWMTDRVTGLERIRVAQVTLSSAFVRDDLTCIDLLKLDVEGSEIKVLAGIEPTTWSAIRQVVVESDGTEKTTRSLVSLLESRGLRRVRVAASPLMEQRGLKNVLIYACR
jgi:FkbM family methyltransferase